MNTFQGGSANSNKSLRFLGWVLGLLFILKSLDFFLSINLIPNSELTPVILEAILFSVSGVAMLLLALGTIRLARWVRIPLYLVFISNALFIIYNTLLVPNWVDASISLVGAVALFFYLKKSRGVATGRRLLGLQILTILTLLPATIFLFLSVVFTDQALQDDSAMRLTAVEPIHDGGNLYITLTSLGDELPSPSDTAEELVSEYPSRWNQVTANQIMRQLQPHIDAYMSGTDQAYQCPTSVNNFAMDAELCALNLMRDYAQLMQFAAIVEAENLSAANALEYALAPIDVGLAIIQSENVILIEYLVGLASINIGLETLELLEQEEFLSRLAIRSELENRSIPPESLRTPMQREYLGMRLALEDNLDLPQNYLYHPNRTRNELYTFMSRVTESNTTSCDIKNDSLAQAEFEQSNFELAEYADSLRANGYNPFKPNIVGRMMLSATLASLTTVRENVCETNERIHSFIN